MKQLGLTFIMILASYSTWSGTNLLDLMKAGKTKYSTVYCQKFLQKADHTTLKAPELIPHIVKLKNNKYLDDYFFHYTDAAILQTALESKMSDRAAAQRTIVQKGGYRSIMEYQMTYSGALTNAKGVGFYVAANPFSSASYGDTQVALRFSQNTNIIDATVHAAVISKAIADKVKAVPEFSGCGEMLQFSLLMNENGIDMAQYYDSSEWLVVFNEDVIIESRVNSVVSESSTAIMQEMVRAGLSASLIEYISEMGLTNSYRIPLSTFESWIPAGQKIQGKSTLLTLAGYLKTWNEATKIGFAKIISSKKGSDLVNLMSEFKTAKLISDDTYFKIPLAQASDDFLANVVGKIKRTPLLAKAWGTLYIDNMNFLFKKSQIDLGFYLSNFPSAAKRAEFYAAYTSKGFSADQNQQILEHMLVNDPSYFQGLAKEAKYIVFNNYMRGAKPDKISSFVASMERLGYDNLSSFNYILARPNTYGANGLAFLAAYIKLKKNPALVTDSLISVLLSKTEFNSTEFMIYLKQNQASFGASASKFAKSSLGIMDVKFLDGIIQPSYSKLFSTEETDLILKRLLMDDTEGAKLVPKFISVFSYSASALASALFREASALRGAGQSALLIIQSIELDATEWSKFTDFSNPKGFLALLAHARLATAKAYILDKTQTLFLLDPTQLSKLNASSLSYLVNAAKVQPYFASYSQEQKLAVSILMKTHAPADADQFLDQVTYTPAMVAAHFNALMSQRGDNERDYEALLNNLGFVAPLTHSQFEFLVTKAVSFKKPLDLMTLIRSDLLTLDRAITLAFKLEKANGEENLRELADHQLNFDSLSDADKKIVLNKFLESFESLSGIVRTQLWNRVFDFALTEKKRSSFLVLTERMTAHQKNALFDYFTSSPSLIQEGLASMPYGPVSFYNLIIENDSLTSVAPILSYIESHYPVSEKYYVLMIEKFGNFTNTNDVQKTHLQNFVCKKVNKYKAFVELIDAEQDKEKKKQLKDQRKNICNGN